MARLRLPQTGEAAAGGGRIWQVYEIREAAAVLMIFTMGFTSLLALLRLYRHAARS